MKITFNASDILGKRIEEDATRRMLTIQETVRAILSEHFTHPSSSNPGHMATKASPETPAPKATKADKRAALLAMSDAEMTAFLKEVGYFPEDGDEKINEVTGAWRKHYVFTDEQGERQYRVVDIEKDGREGYRNIYFVKTGEFMNDLMRNKIV